MSPDTADLFPIPQRHFLPDSFCGDSWEEISPVLNELEKRPIESVEDFEQWLLDRSELDSMLSGYGSRLMVASARNTQDIGVEAAYLEFQTEIIPQIKPVEDRLDRRFLESKFRSQLDANRWAIYDRESSLAVRLYQKENIALEAIEEERTLEYGKTTGAMTVEFQGATRTLPAMASFTESSDRSVREAAWRMTSARRLKDKESLNELFHDLVELRQSMGRNAGFPDFREYKHLCWGRLDYSPDDCLVFHGNVEKYVLPLLHEMDAHRQQCLGVDQLRPWDLAVDLEGEAAFEPFQREEEQVKLGVDLLTKVHPTFGRDLHWMAQENLLDLATRPNKRHGGFMDTFEDVRHPFIFSNSGTTHGDVETLVHEGGHAVHALLSRDLEPVGARNPPLEFAEVASMGMECMAMEHLSHVYPAPEARRCTLQSLEGIVRSLAWIATIDAFQHKVYSQEKDQTEFRQKAWLDLRQRFGSVLDWSGLEDSLAWDWQRTLHLYEVPFYYIEYGIAQNGALQVWSRYKSNPEKTVIEFKKGLALGGSRSLPELFQASGLVFDPQGSQLKDLMASVRSAWKHQAGVSS